MVARLFLTSLAFALASGVSAHALGISNPVLSVKQLANGALDAYVYGGSDFFNPGASVSDYGFRDQAGAFGLATTGGSVNGPIVVGAQTGGGMTASVSGTFNGAWEFTRSFVLDPSSPVLAVSINVTRIAAGSGVLTLFETADPGHGGAATANDVFVDATSGATVSRSVSSGGGLTSAVGSYGGVVGFGGGGSAFGLGVHTGAELLDLLAAPYDPDGMIADIGFAHAFQMALSQGQSATVTTWWAAGLNPGDALLALQAAAVPPTVVSTPPALPLLATAIALMAAPRLRRRG